MRTVAPLVSQDGLCVVTICVDQDTAEKVRQATLKEKGLFVGELQDYSLHVGEVQTLLKIQNAEHAVCVIDFDNDRNLAVQTANSIRQMLHGRSTIIALSDKADPTLILEAMRSGCSEYLTKPLNVDQVVESLARLHGQIHETQKSLPSGRVLAFLGCRGGVGTTTLAVHLGTFLARAMGKKTIVVDQHPHLGHVGLYLGHDNTNYDFYEVVRNVARLDQTLLGSLIAHHASGLDVLPAPGVLNGQMNIPFEAVERAIQFIAGVYEYVVVDCPQGVDDLNLVTIDCCEELYLVTTADVPSLRDLSRYVDRLLQCNVPPNKVKVVVNRYSSDAAVTLEQIEKAIRQPISITIPNNPNELVRAMNTGSPISPDRRSEFTNQMKKWAASVVPVMENAPVEEPKRRFSLWK